MVGLQGLWSLARQPSAPRRKQTEAHSRIQLTAISVANVVDQS
jgi:hypothetical protein